MKYTYLAASLPGLRLQETPPTSVEDFLSQCQGVLEAGDRTDLRLVCDGRSGEATAPAARRWHSVDTQMRNAIANLRATRLGIDARPYQRPFSGFSVSVETVVQEAFGKHNPLERELHLDRCRWSVLDELATRDAFGFGAILAHGLKLRIAQRWAPAEVETGEQRFHQAVDKNLDVRGYVNEYDVSVEY
jgi:hypothetical protein